MKHKNILYIIFICLFIFTTNLYAQNVIIQCKGDNLLGKNIRISYFADRISLLEKNAIDTIINKDTNNLVFYLTLDQIKEISFKIENKEYHFLACPGNTYSLNILPYNDSVYSFTYKEILQVDFSMEKDDNINDGINEIDSVLNDFVFYNQRLLFSKDALTLQNFDSIEQNLIIKYKNNEYLQNYIKYEFASVKYGFSLSSKLKIKEDLFKNSAILYDNIGYMDCFNTVFSHYFSKGYKFISTNDIENWLDANNYAAFNDALGRDNILENEIFREFVFLQGMKDAFLDGIFSKERILKMLDKFETLTKFPEHKEIAYNLKEYLTTRNFSGKKLKNLNVKNIDGNKISLNQYMDKPLVVCLIQLDCTSCLKELETIHFYYDSIKNNCNVIAICFDNTFEKMYNFVKNSKTGSKYKFPILYFDYNWQLAEDYNLHFFPTFVLVNTDGTVKRNPMENPSSGSLKQFMNKTK